MVSFNVAVIVIHGCRKPFLVAGIGILQLHVSSWSFVSIVTAIASTCFGVSGKCLQKSVRNFDRSGPFALRSTHCTHVLSATNSQQAQTACLVLLSLMKRLSWWAEYCIMLDGPQWQVSIRVENTEHSRTLTPIQHCTLADNVFADCTFAPFMHI